MGAWIEIFTAQGMVPTWSAVAPLVGAWIEIGLQCAQHIAVPVAPLVGAWIEIVFMVIPKAIRESSLPSWERGLKLKNPRLD